ncbi:polysaccharide biosynthesis/export family protein [Jiella avicenniae]|uniref:Polysaccharide export protein n=1 Tax=Jiella avicenniae TaxID=2907202 RepID=A0A9X1P6T2_9HYPH|nr:polysaccharide biosynthesis/export family protein [Jiella avicenniae]MCE7030859.1 polysaccharide export protein [Jiella avicenniae]
MTFHRRQALMCGVSALLALSGCQTLPRSGPDDAVIRDNATLYFAADEKKPLTNYVLVDLTEPVLSYFPKAQRQSFRSGFGATRKGPPDLPLGVGDVVEVTLFESAAGGLFIPAEAGTRPGNFITLPRQVIDTNGYISVPYAGLIPAVGRTTEQVQDIIVQRLADRAIEPQAVINLIESRSSEISVLGDVNSPAKLAINPGGEKVLDALSRAGGISAPSAETSITLQRNGTTATVLFDDLIANPRENIFVYPGDVIYANRDRRTYLAFGASGLNGRIDFEDSDLTLAEAVGKAGGLLDGRADPGQVFLYRLVDPETLSAMGFPVTAKTEGGFPVIFRTNMRDPSAYFLAQRFPMQDKDILYVSNADSVELVKFLSVINSATSGTVAPIVDVAAAKTAVKVIGD